jgi:hypothetical protein
MIHGPKRQMNGPGEQIGFFELILLFAKIFPSVFSPVEGTWRNQLKFRKAGKN